MSDDLERARGAVVDAWAASPERRSAALDRFEAAVRAEQRVADALEFPVMVRDGVLQGYCTYDCGRCHDDECPCPNCLRLWGRYDESVYEAGIREAALRPVAEEGHE